MLATFGLIVGAALGILFLIFALSTAIGVPFLPTHRRQAVWAIEKFVRPGMTVIDLGSGAGRLLFMAAGREARAIGYELNPFLVWWTRLMARFKGFSSRVEVRGQSLYQAQVGEADVVYAFLFNGPMAKLSQKLFSEMKPGSLIVSYTFPIPDKKTIIEEQGFYVYKV